MPSICLTLYSLPQVFTHKIPTSLTVLEISRTEMLGCSEPRRLTCQGHVVTRRWATPRSQSSERCSLLFHMLLASHVINTRRSIVVAVASGKPRPASASACSCGNNWAPQQEPSQQPPPPSNPKEASVRGGEREPLFPIHFLFLLAHPQIKEGLTKPSCSSMQHRSVVSTVWVWIPALDTLILWSWAHYLISLNLSLSS